MSTAILYGSQVVDRRRSNLTTMATTRVKKNQRVTVFTTRVRAQPIFDVGLLYCIQVQYYPVGGLE